MSIKRSSRKNQLGNSNYSEDGLSIDTSATKKFRCIMQKIVQRDPPDANIYQSLANPKHREVQKMAIWTAGRDTESNDFRTTNKVDYPSVLLAPKPILIQKEKEDLVRRNMRAQSMESFRKLVRTEYGHAAKLFKAARKSKQDVITSEDFSYLMSRLKLDKQFPRESQELMFESMPKDRESGVAIIDIISKIDEIDMKDSQLVASKKEMADIRQFLSVKLDEKRAKDIIDKNDDDVRTLNGDSSVSSAKSSASQSSNGKKDFNLEDAMKVAIGQKTFDIEVGSEELNELIEDIYHKRSTRESTEGFARFLRFSNLKLHEIPFYDLRKSDLQGRKTRALNYEEQCCDPILIARHLQARKSKMENAKELSRLDLKNKEIARVEHLERWGDLTEHPLAPKKRNPFKDGVDTDDTSLASTVNTPTSHSGKEEYYVSERSSNLPDRHALSPGTLSLSVSPSLSLSPIRGRNLLGHPNIIPFSTDQSDKSDFHPRTVTHSKTSVPDPSMLLLVAPQFSSRKSFASGKKRAPILPTDFGRVGYGGNSTLYDTKPQGFKDPKYMGSNNSLEEISVLSGKSGSYLSGNRDAHMNNDDLSVSGNSRVESTVSSSTLPTSISKHYIGCDDKEVRDARRRARHNRTSINVENTRRRLEDEILDQKVKDLFNMKSRNEDNIRYDTNVFANDVKCYRSQPLQIQSRKPFLSRSDRMWGGNENAVQLSMNNDEDRDFSYTYKDAYNSQILRDSVKDLHSIHGF